VLTALFMRAGVIRRSGGEQLDKLGGLYASAPGLAALFLVPALSLSGIPPFSGFFAKLALLRAGLAAGLAAIVATALVASLLTLLAVTLHAGRREGCADDRLGLGL
jgi:multicomponent Na+:H+ antiporter subunit D